MPKIWKSYIFRIPIFHELRHDHSSKSNEGWNWKRYQLIWKEMKREVRHVKAIQRGSISWSATCHQGHCQGHSIPTVTTPGTVATSHLWQASPDRPPETLPGQSWNVHPALNCLASNWWDTRIPVRTWAPEPSMHPRALHASQSPPCAPELSMYPRALHAPQSLPWAPGSKTGRGRRGDSIPS